jgi:hypothetical protein
MVPFIEKHIALIKHKIQGARSNGLFESRSIDLKSRYYVEEGGLHDLEKKDRMIVSLHPWVRPFCNSNSENIDYIEQCVSLYCLLHVTDLQCMRQPPRHVLCGYFVCQWLRTNGHYYNHPEDIS